LQFVDGESAQHNEHAFCDNEVLGSVCVSAAAASAASVAAAAAADLCFWQTRLERAGAATFVTLLEMQAKNK
jgi:hypothetical protein